MTSAWNKSTGQCFSAKIYWFCFSCSTLLQAFRVLQFAETLKREFDAWLRAVNGLKIGYLGKITRGEWPRELLVLTSGDGREILETVSKEHVISTRIHVWHPGSRRIFAAVSHADGRFCCHALVSLLRYVRDKRTMCHTFF